jgi:NADH-quinone oxidoreductase subunit N
MKQELSFQIFMASPLIALAIGALFVLLWEVLSPAPIEKRKRGGALLTISFSLIALILLHMTAPGLERGATVFNGALYIDSLSYFVTFFLILGTIFSVFLSMGNLLKLQGVDAIGEYYSLLLITTIGAIVLGNAAEMIVLFLGLETMSLALYCLCASALRNERSSESGLKYFILGSFSSAFLLYGIALAYGVSGTTSIEGIAAAASGASPLFAAQASGISVLMLSLGLMIIGLAFKVAAVPFHFWAPDVYEGAPTSITAYMAVVIKAAAVFAFLRVIWIAFGDLIAVWSGIIWMLAILSMVLGNLVALRQNSVKRMLAYSSIAHAGYIMMAFLVPTEAFGGGPALVYYLVAYLLMSFGAFSVLLVLGSRSADFQKNESFRAFYGLHQVNPFLAVSMALFMLALAGLPPGLSGLFGKFYVFSAAIKGGYTGLAIVGVLASAVSFYYYLRVVVAMYFHEPDEAGAKISVPSSLKWIILICAAGIILIGIFPSLLYQSGIALIGNSF